MNTPTPTQVKRALQKVENVSDFCRRHELPERTVWRARAKTPSYTPGATVLKVLVMALTSDGLLEVPQARAKRKVAA